MKTALVTGADGFIGSHTTRRLKDEGYFVRAIGRRQKEDAASGALLANEYIQADLRSETVCMAAVRHGGLPFDEVYQFAAEMGGLGYLPSAECDIMRNSQLINLHMIHSAAEAGVGKFFFSSSACVYRDQALGEEELPESAAYPALPDNEYGWEKLFSERVLQTYGRKYRMLARVGRFQNTYGPESAWRGIRRKSVAAVCEKVICCPEDGEIEIWGDGYAVRAFIYISDLVDGIRAVMSSPLADDQAYNIGRREYVTVNQLVDKVVAISGKKIHINHVMGPTGVRNRTFRVDRLEALGWKSKVSLEAGLLPTYRWIESQVQALKKA